MQRAPQGHGPRTPRGGAGDRGPRGPHGPQTSWTPPPQRATDNDAPALPEDPARRERALLLRSFESSPLTATNFCALKGLALGDFEAQIALARRERDERARAAGGGGGSR